jgi:hypothetical protein
VNVRGLNQDEKKHGGIHIGLNQDEGDTWRKHTEG